MTIDERIDRIGRHRFRQKFHLYARDRATVELRGMDVIRAHANDLIAKKLAPEQPHKDGKQTPYRGHPVFVAQHATAPVHDLTGPRTLGEFCELIHALELFPAPPVREVSPLYRRWAFESAALDLALRQAGTSLHERVGLTPDPLTFVVSLRLGDP